MVRTKHSSQCEEKYVFLCKENFLKEWYSIFFVVFPKPLVRFCVTALVRFQLCLVEC